YTINPNTGALTPLTGSPFTFTGVTAPTSVSASDASLYVTNPGPDAATNGTISVATIDGAGALTGITGSPFGANLVPTSGQYFPGGDYPSFNNYYLEVDSQSDTVSPYVVDGTTGALTLASGGRVGVGAGATAVSAFVYTPVDDFVTDNVYVT